MKTKTLSAVAVGIVISLASCGETKPAETKPAPETAEQIKKAEDAMNELDQTIQDIDHKEADLDAALENLDF